MELKNIHTFIKVAEFQNFTKASAELGYAQSTVTMQIQQLENELHANLFERNGKRIRLSAAGQEFLKYAYQISKYETMAINHFHRTEEPEGNLNIGIMETLCSSEYTDLFYTFQEKYPKISLRLEVVTTLKAMEDLDKGACKDHIRHAALQNGAAAHRYGGLVDLFGFLHTDGGIVNALDNTLRAFFQKFNLNFTKVW